MKYILILLAFALTELHAQTPLKFNNRLIDSEDRWVAFPLSKDSVYNFGFVYVDDIAGLTLHHAGSFVISPNGTFIPNKRPEYQVMKIHLEPPGVQVAFIPGDKFKDLEIAAVPDWLKIYKTDTTSVRRTYSRASLYNHWGECAKALTYLERVKQMDPKYKGLDVEMAFSYNCMSLFDKAAPILTRLLQENPKDAYASKELIYAQVQSNKLSEAVETCKKALANSQDTQFHPENCYNILYQYFLKKDKKNFLIWLDESKKWPSKNPNIHAAIKSMEAELAK